ncbi:ribosomal protein S15 precursor-like protein [Hypoxylon trugodes]|uniref:ribosomal protein S15 precursor-like protein n=1 Tax=Hypoxylon trugodes TaxID=326681 RepID=UPI00219D2C90|nr:ribosomal protein S15 precursor-like protein [Hypoxylon trugodes]KAI1382732.1 ribosomal protein S15 precursor-like protein [Hypoxylon trugodes]
MSPRIPGVQRLGTFSLCLRPTVKPSTPSLLPVTQTASLSQKEKRRIMKQEPYRWAQMQQRKAAHLKRRESIEALTNSQFGDPIRGIPTPFVESFDSAGQAPLSKPALDDDGNPIEEPRELPTSPYVLNNLIHKKELESAIGNAYVLTKPMESDLSPAGSPEYEKKVELHKQYHAKAVEALERITSLENGSAKDRLHANIRRCIETFGRHETDLILKPKALSRGQQKEERPVRGGPDTGSSEVQIAILTTKINALADALGKNRGHKDKVGKRDLRLMLHRRQKLMRYMDRKEKGSDRWKHMIETLGLSPATWKEQITT